MTTTAPYATITPIRYSATQLAAVAQSGGWPQADLQTAVAVALAESSGNCVAIGPSVGGARAYGVMQIMYPTHADLFASGIGSGYWMDAETNFTMGLKVYQSQGWGAWTTYKTGAYRLYSATAAAGVTAWNKALAAANGNVKNAALTVVGTAILQQTGAAELEWQTGLGLSGVAGDVGGAISAVGGDVASSVAADTGSTAPLVRAVEVIIGGLLLALGLYQLTRPVTAPAVSAVKTAAKIVK
jgi:hypothetical protein